MSVHARRRGALLALLLAVLAALALAPAPALAHASLVSSTPASGARLDSLPEQVRLEFSEEVLAPAYVVITGPDGESVTVGEPTVRGTVVTQATASGPDGGYTLAYRAVSKDGHVVTGQIGFAVGDAAALPTPPAESDGPDIDATAAPEAAEQAGEDGLGRTAIAVLVGAGLFAGAGLLLLASRRVE